MRRTWITLILLALFILEGSVLPWLLPAVWQSRVLVAPDFVLIVILYLTMYVNRHLALVYGLSFGMLHDIVYGPMLGSYSFSMGLTAYLIGLAFRRPHLQIVSSLFLAALGDFLFQMVHYGVYRLFNLLQTPFEWVLTHAILPSVLLNALFALLIYVPFRKLADRRAVAAEDTDE